MKRQEKDALEVLAKELMCGLGKAYSLVLALYPPPEQGSVLLLGDDSIVTYVLWQVGGKTTFFTHARETDKWRPLDVGEGAWAHLAGHTTAQVKLLYQLLTGQQL